MFDSSRQVDNVSLQKRVLVADDQRPTRRGLRALLNLLPGVLWVGEAVDGREAVRLARDRRPDIVVMDARMPLMDGIEATHQIKAVRPQVKVIVLSMYAEYRAEALAAGADIFLLKCGTFDELRTAVSSE